MIPLTLQLKNFLSYGPQLQTIDFGKHPLICLSGKNGHGKSALLDAITWAIWGQARKVPTSSKPDEGLLRLGQTHMLVMLDFTFNARSYRVRREFTLHLGKATAHLEFGIIDADTKHVIPLTDKTIRATQAKIEQTIGLDFDAFVNSAFLRQGNSNEFSQKSPKERKEILAAILGLGQYEELRKRALEKVKKGQEEQATLAATKQRLEQVVATGAQQAQRRQQVAEQLNLVQEQASAHATYQQQLQEAHVLAIHQTNARAQESQLLEKIRKTRREWRSVHAQQLAQEQTPQLAKSGLRPSGLRPIEQLEQQFERKRTYYQRYIAMGNMLSSQKEELLNKQHLTETDDPSCPLCEQNLSVARKQFLKQKFVENLRFLEHRISRLATVVARLKTILTEQHAIRTRLLQEYQTFAQAMGGQAQRREVVRECMAHIWTLRAEQTRLAQQISALGLPADLNITRAHQEATKRGQELAYQKELLLQEKGKLAAEQQQLEQVQREIPELNTQIKKWAAECDDYQIIATALGKDGIQALLIEEAMPEIEQEANRLLGKLTDNQAQLMIDSMRDLKKGGTRETLDIKISDALGIRPYEMFSGGEAFRIDFALRIAIAKLLARRAGTSLQTLIIDEGFGSQDEEGLNHIMDALYKIQDDFAKVIIVSHLPSMKDQFPVHLVIEKGAHGSRVVTVTQG